MVSIAVLMPSRGLIFSETIEEVLREVAPFSYEIFFAHARPIPEAFNEPLKKILVRSFDYVWIVEEDMVLPKGILRELIGMNAPVAISDYPAVEGHMCIKRDARGEVLYAGTGCLLVRQSVFSSLQKPVFSTDNIYDASGNFTAKRDPREKVYGQQDVDFFQQIRALGLPIGVTRTTCNQRKIVEYGAREVNDGFHRIKII